MLNIVKKITPTTEVRDKDAFPIEVFPELLQGYIAELEAALGYPADYTAPAVLFTTSVLIGNTREIELKKGFTAGAPIFLLSVGRPSIQKSRPIKKVTEYLEKVDKQNYKEYRKALADREKEKGNDNESKPKPECINYLLKDFTPESLVYELAKNKRGLGLYSDEFLSIINSSLGGRYSGGSSEEMLLSGWSQLPYKQTRVTKDQMNVDRPFFSIIGTTQPMKLKNAFKGKEQNGLTDRILFVYPKQNRLNLWNSNAVDLSLHEDWNDFLLDLHRKLDFDFDEYGNCISKTVRMSIEAQTTIIKWQNEQETRMMKEDEETQSIAGKMQDYVLRFCLILHTMEWQAGNSEEFIMSADTAKRAIILADYFMYQAQKVRDFIYSNNDAQIETLSADKRDLYHELPEAFTMSEGQEMAEKKGLSQSSAKRFFTNEKYFKKVAHGKYQKA